MSVRVTVHLIDVGAHFRVFAMTSPYSSSTISWRRGQRAAPPVSRT